MTTFNFGGGNKGPGGGAGGGGGTTGKVGDAGVERLSCENKEPNINAAVFDLVIISFSGSILCTGVDAVGAEGRRMDLRVLERETGGSEGGMIGSTGSGRDGKRRGKGLIGVGACAFVGLVSSFKV